MNLLMSSSDLSSYDPKELPSAAEMRFGLVVADWNPEITRPMLDAATDTLRKAGCQENDIVTHFVPGSFELPLGAKWLLDAATPDAIICIGCVIRGETPHFDFISQAVTIGLMQLQLDYAVPVIFGVLTTNDLQQAKDRSGGKYGNKGVEAALTAIRMAALRRGI